MKLRRVVGIGAAITHPRTSGAGAGKGMDAAVGAPTVDQMKRAIEHTGK